MATLARNWWALVLRGVLAILFGIATFIWPGLTLTTLVFLFGAYVLVDGVFAIIAAITGNSTGQIMRLPRWALFIEGVVGVIAGIMTFAWPGITALVLLILIGTWSIVTGIFELVSAFQLRQAIQNEFFLGLSGAISIIFGIIVLVQPESGLLAIAWLIGFYAVLFGVMLVALGLRLRQHAGTTTSGRPGGLTPA